MSEKEIIEYIGYKGKYNKEVKQKFKALLKKYHPDHNKGQDDTFKLINKLKNQIEKGEYHFNEVHEDYVDNVPDYDKSELLIEIKKLESEKEIYANAREKLNNELNILYDRYSKVFNKNLDNSILEVDYHTEIKNYQKIMYYFSIVVVFIIFVLIYAYIVNRNIAILLILLLFVIIYTILVYNLKKKVSNLKRLDHKQTIIDKKNRVNYDDLNQKINYFHRQMWNYDKKIINIDNKIRLYKNRINNENTKKDIN